MFGDRMAPGYSIAGDGPPSENIRRHKEGQTFQNGKLRAVAGLIDLSARVHLNRQLAPNLMTLALPLAMFDEREGNVEGSFLGRHTWQSLVAGKE